ncbi:MAG: hypothetical protein JJE55_02875 [Flavobacteriaceae bacterium]|nr:hypothetical protein [Flavobacteriaceae bacterium]
MKTKLLREKVIAYLNEADDDTLRIVNEVIENYIAKNIVAYSAEGKPMSKEEYIKSVKAADTSMDAGDFTSVADLEKEVRNW